MYSLGIYKGDYNSIAIKIDEYTSLKQLDKYCNNFKNEQELKNEIKQIMFFDSKIQNLLNQNYKLSVLKIKKDDKGKFHYEPLPIHYSGYNQILKNDNLIDFTNENFINELKKNVMFSPDSKRPTKKYYDMIYSFYEYMDKLSRKENVSLYEVKFLRDFFTFAKSDYYFIRKFIDFYVSFYGLQEQLSNPKIVNPMYINSLDEFPLSIKGYGDKEDLYDLFPPDSLSLEQFYNETNKLYEESLNKEEYTKRL